ncbi:MAG: NDP-sugar pyrophosphorylase family protein [Arenicella sp.]|jgi:NDP-sugar pyrophosphorylase family protein
MAQTILFTDSANNPLPPLDERLPSSLLPMAGKSKLVFWLEHCYRARLRDIMIISPEWQLIKASISDGTKYGVSIKYANHLEENEEEKIGWCINADLLVDFDSKKLNTLVADNSQVHLDSQVVAAFCRLKPGAGDFRSATIEANAITTTLDGHVLAMTTVQDFHANVLSVLERNYDSLLPGGMTDETSPKIYLDGLVKWNRNSLKAGSLYCGGGTQIDKTVEITSSTAIEKDCFIDKEARISNSVVLPGSYIGKMTEVENSIVWGRLLIRVDTNTVITMPDDVILADQTRRRKKTGVKSRLTKWFKPAES